MDWTRDQKKIIDAANCNLLVSAAAGSGKTAVLVERIIQKICNSDNPINVDELLVVTFTKAAASQMKDKIRIAIEHKLEEEPGNEHLQQQLYLLNQANIMTIDSFCYKVVKEHFHVLNIDPGVKVGEAGEIGLLREKILDDVIEEFYRDNDGFVSFSEAFCRDKDDDKLEEYIGKVYDISSSYPRPEQWTLEGRKELQITCEEDFMNLSYVKPYIEQIHMVAEDIKSQILDMLELARGIDGPSYMEKALLSDVELVDGIISANTYSMFHDLFSWKFANIGRGKAGTFHEDVAQQIKDVRGRYKDDIKDILKGFELPFSTLLSQYKGQEKMLVSLLDITDEFRSRFLEAKKQKNILEFSDVEHFALDILCDGYEEDGTPIQSIIGKEMSEDFYEIMIDEYQDSNYLQEAILYCVSSIPRGTNNMFMVGDVKQSIYRFRMARPDIFMDKYHRFSEDEKASERRLLLKNNFRSRKNVLEGINYIFYQIMENDLGGIQYTTDEALVPSRDFPAYDYGHVELLLGESKDFEFLKVDEDDVALSPVKDENLNENLEDIGRKELEATMVANKIQKLMGKQGDAFRVLDDTTGELRDIQYKDIVILFRAPSGYSSVFQQVLSGYGIPVHIQNENGYLDTVEIHQVLSLLRVLDNPCNDVELVATLRGYFGCFTEHDLAKLIIQKRQWEEKNNRPVTIYKILTHYDGDFGDLKKKCQDFTHFFETLKLKQKYMSISQLVDYIFYETGYYYYTEAMPEGNGRIRNMDLFRDEVIHFERDSYKGVFDFLLYIDGIIKNAISLGGDPFPDSDEDAVRIMSIHKSKGLEFPVVFVSGMGQQFNLQDTKTPLIVHSDYHIGAKYVDTKKRCGNDSFARQTMSQLIRIENIAEELRIFYVALTRAKEKLIMTGVTPDVPMLVHKYDEIAKKTDIQLGFSVLRRVNSYMDLVVASFIRNEIFWEAMKNVRKRMDKKGEHIISADYECERFIAAPDFDLKVEVFDFHNLAVSHIIKGGEEGLERREKLELWRNNPGCNEEHINKNLNWIYGDMNMTKQKSKLSVTEIKRIYEKDFDPFALPVYETLMAKYKPPIPRFASKKAPLNAAQKGTLVHKAMELLDFDTLSTSDDVKLWLDKMVLQERLDSQIKQILTVDNICRFLDSDLGKRMKQASKSCDLYKERKFVIGVPVSKIMSGKTIKESEDKKVVVQGIIDAYFEEDGKIILVDYKTDYIEEGNESMLVDRYTTQLRYYKDTLEQLLMKDVSETYLYSFALGKEIKMF